MASKLEALHARYYERLLPAARRLCQGITGIEPADLVQETLARFLEQVERLTRAASDTPMEGWLISVMTRYFIDQRRRVQSQQKAEDDPTLTRWTQRQEEDAPATYERITHERFDWAIEQLPTKQRITLLLRNQGLRNQEIASRLGVSDNVVGKRLSDARQRLKELLQPYVEEESH